MNSLLPGSGWFPPIHIWDYSSSLRILLPAFNLGTWETEEDRFLWVLRQPGLLPCFEKRNKNKTKQNETKQKSKQNKTQNQPIKQTKIPRTLLSLAFQVPFSPTPSLFFFFNCFYFHTSMNLQNSCKWSAKDVWDTRLSVDRTRCLINLENFTVSYTQWTRVFFWWDHPNRQSNSKSHILVLFSFSLLIWFFFLSLCVYSTDFHPFLSPPLPLLFF